jgi:hypothetical protein
MIKTKYFGYKWNKSIQFVVFYHINTLSYGSSLLSLPLITIHTEGDHLPLNTTHKTALSLIAGCLPISPGFLFHQLPRLPDHTRIDLDATSRSLPLVLPAQ